MQIKDVMTSNVRTVSADETVQTAATLMSTENVGSIPVVGDDKLVGMLTDRDITTRLVAQQRDPSKTPVSAVMSEDLRYCFEDDDCREVSRNMAEQRVLRLPVVNRDKKLVGIVSAGDLVTKAGEHEANEVQSESSKLDESLEETFPASDPISPA